jgi:DNA repair protein RecO (recombination protein O)
MHGSPPSVGRGCIPVNLENSGGRLAIPTLLDCDNPPVATYETEAVVLRAIRYGEADSVLTLLTLERGRVSAIAKGARRARSRLGGRLQPAARVALTLHEGRGDMDTVRSASTLDPHGGLWERGQRLRAAGCVLEAALRALPEREANPGAYHLVTRSLALLATADEAPGPPRLHPYVLGTSAKLLVVAGLLPRLGACASCGAGPPLVAFSASAGGALCGACRGLGEPVEPPALLALAELIGRPLAEAPEALPPRAAHEVERLVGLVLREHLGVVLRSAAPL